MGMDAPFDRAYIEDRCEQLGRQTARGIPQTTAVSVEHGPISSVPSCGSSNIISWLGTCTTYVVKLNKRYLQACSKYKVETVHKR